MPQRRFQLYGRRKTKPLRARQRHLVDELLPRLRVTLPASGKLAPLPLFAQPVREVWLEIGFGGGEHLAALASLDPGVGFIGAEPFVNGVAKLLLAIADGVIDQSHIVAELGEVLGYGEDMIRKIERGARIPRPEMSAVGKASQGTILQDAAFGFKYIWARKPLVEVTLKPGSQISSCRWCVP